MRTRSRRAAAACALAAMSAAAAASAQVVRDGSLGVGTRTFTGPAIEITPAHGKQVGSNLFHSFRQFDLAKGDVARFTGPPSVSNVLTRVTGGSPSNINGTIGCSIPNANFYFINPAGVVFGPETQIDITGSFAVTTADVIRLGEGGVFHASPTAGGVLTTAAPVAFGFLGGRSAEVALEGGSLTNGIGAVRVAAGSIRMVSGPPRDDEPAPGVFVGGGVVELVAVADAAVEVAVAAPAGAEIVLGGAVASGRIDLADARVSSQQFFSLESPEVSSPGRLVIRGGRLAAVRSSVEAGGNLDARVAGDVRLAEGSRLAVTGQQITRDGSFVDDPPQVEVGDVDLRVGGSLTLAGGAQVLTLAGVGSFTSTTPSSSVIGGDVRVAADRVVIERGAIQTLATEADSFAPGPNVGGAVNVESNELLFAADTLFGAVIASRTRADGVGGDVTVTAGRIDVPLGLATAVTAETLGTGPAGSAVVNGAAPPGGAITTDGTTGTAGPGTVQGPAFVLDAGQYATRAGGNLFYSFGVFDVTAGQTATFTTGAPAGGAPAADRVIARVTGGTASILDGRVGTAPDLDGAALYLLNPAGVMFGPNTVVDVTAAFAATTADRLLLDDGGRFEPAADVLTGGAPSGFDFTAAAPAPITVEDARLIGRPSRDIVDEFGDPTSTPPGFTGAAVSLVGGELRLTGDGDDPLGDGVGVRLSPRSDADGPLGVIAAPEGRINFVALAGPGQVALDAESILPATPDPEFPEPPDELAPVQLSPGATPGTVTVRGAYGESDLVVVRAGDLTLDSAEISGGREFGFFTEAGGIDVELSGVLSASGSALVTDSEEHPAPIRLVAQSVVLSDTGVSADAMDGQGGAIEIHATRGDLRLDRGTSISSDAGFVRSFGGGDITITAAGDLALDDADISADSSADIGGAAGVVTLDAGGAVSLARSSVSASTGFGSAGAGAILVRAGGDLRLEDSTLVSGGFGGRSQFVSGGSGGGTVTAIAGGDLLLSDSDVVTAGTTSGGEIALAAGRDLLVTGGRITSEGRTGGSTSLLAPGRISLDGGRVVATADETAGNIIVGASITPGGAVAPAESIVLNDATVQAETLGVDPEASGGGLTVAAARIDLSGTTVSSGTAGTGRGGTVLLSSTEGMRLARGSVVSTASRSLGAGGRGGDLILDASTGPLELIEGSSASASTAGLGRGGNVTVTAGALTIDPRGFTDPARPTGIFAETSGAVVSGLPPYTVELTIESLINDFSSDVVLVSPLGTRVKLVDGANVILVPFIGTIFDDSADQSIELETFFGEAYTGPFRPSEPLARLDGELPNGQWTLELTDFGGENPTLRSWALNAGGRRFPSSDVPKPLGQQEVRSIVAVDLGTLPSIGGAGGDITVRAGSVRVLDGGAISASGTGAGSAGRVSIESATRIDLLDLRTAAERAAGPTRITTSTAATGGDITLTAPDFIYLLNASVNAQAGRDGAAVTVSGPPLVVLNNSTINGLAGGTPKPVTIRTGSLVASSDSRILANIVNFEVEVDVTSGLAQLARALVGAQARLEELCGVRFGGDVSSFLVTGRNGVPPEPTGLSSSQPEPGKAREPRPQSNPE